MMHNIQEQVSPQLLNSIVQSMDAYDVRTLKYTREYVRQCKAGVIRHPVVSDLRKTFEDLYPAVCHGGNFEVPFIFGRDHAPYQIYTYRDADRDAAWQHFQTLCLGQMVLHRRFDYELSVMIDDRTRRDLPPFLADLRTFDARQTIREFRPQELESVLEEAYEYARRIRRDRLKQDYPTVWDYNAANPGARLPYRLIALWDFPAGADGGTLNYVYNIYNKLESCGVFFLFMMNNDRYEIPDAGMSAESQNSFKELKKLMDAFPILLYNRDVRGYESLGDRSYTYHIEEYRTISG